MGRAAQGRERIWCDHRTCTKVAECGVCRRPFYACQDESDDCWHSLEEIADHAAAFAKDWQNDERIVTHNGVHGGRREL